MVSEARKQSMARMETDYSKHTYFRWKVKWRLEHLGALGTMDDTAPLNVANVNIYTRNDTKVTFQKLRRGCNKQWLLSPGVLNLFRLFYYQLLVLFSRCRPLVWKEIK